MLHESRPTFAAKAALGGYGSGGSPLKASDFLDIGKQRLLRLRFPDFTMYGGFSGLLDVHLSEIMNDSPDITIGGLVVPELTLSLDSTQGGTMASVLYQEAICEIGLEQKREDVTAALLQMQAAHPGRKLCFTRCRNGLWMCSSGKDIYFNSGVWHSAQDISGLYLDEVRMVLYLLHETDPVCTYFSMNDEGLTGTEQVLRPVSALHEAVLRDFSRHRTGITETADSVLLTELRESVYFKDGALQHDILSGTATAFACASYGDFTLTDTNIQDDDTMEAVGYGELGKLAGIPAGDFFSEEHIHEGDTLLMVLENFLVWLLEKGVFLTLGQQTYLNLDKLTVSPDWAERDYSGITAADFLRDLAMHEAGNAYLNKDGLLVFGWCNEEPVLTVTADEMASLRLGTDMVTGADGFRYGNSAVQNCIWTEANGDSTAYLLGNEAYTASFDAVTERFSDISVLPFTADALAGSSPLLRVGDCIRVVTKNRAVVRVPVLMQEVQGFPFLNAKLEAPDGTSWRTVPADLLANVIQRIETDGWPETIPDGELPDFSGLTVTAFPKNEEPFFPDGYRFTYREYGGYIWAAVSYAGFTVTRQIPITNALRTKDGGLFYTKNGAYLSARKGTS